MKRLHNKCYVMCDSERDRKMKVFLHYCCVLPVHIDGLQEAEGHPGPQEKDVVAEDHDTDEESSPKDEGFSGMSIFGLHPKRSLRATQQTHSDMDT